MCVRNRSYLYAHIPLGMVPMTVYLITLTLY